jgi:hypothetical protein
MVEMYPATVQFPEQASVTQEERQRLNLIMTVMPKFPNVNMRSGAGVQFSWVGKMAGRTYKIVEVRRVGEDRASAASGVIM